MIDKLFTFDYVLEEVAKQEGWKYETEINFKDIKLNHYDARDPKFISMLMTLQRDWKELKGILKAYFKDIFEEEKTKEELFLNDFLIIEYKEDGEEKSKKVNVDRVAEYIEENFNIRTIYGLKEETIEVYQNGIWMVKGKGIIKGEIERILKIYSKNNIVSEILEKIKRRTEVEREETDKIPLYKRAVKNGVLDIENPEEIKLIPHSKKFNFRNKWDINYSPKSKCPKAMEFIKQTFYDEDVPKFQEWLGLHLIQHYPFKNFSIFHGQRDTGKSIILNLLTIFLNSNVSRLSLQKISIGKPFDLLNLKDKDANICDDLSSSDVKATGGIKMSVGDGFIEGEMKFGDKINFRNSAKQTFACNKIPNPGEDIDDEAYYGRILLFPIDNIVPKNKQDKNLINKITTKEELSGLLNWAIEGYKRLVKQNGFTNDRTPEENKFLMLQSGNSLAEFSSEILTQENGAKISKESMYRAYCKWCENHKPQLSPDSKEKIGRSLNRFAPYLQAKSDGSSRYWLNVKFTDTYYTFSKTYRAKLEGNNIL
jgi:putative DNA primase/helicase